MYGVGSLESTWGWIRVYFGLVSDLFRVALVFFFVGLKFGVYVGLNWGLLI
jgi:hypothetical protein